MDNDENTNNEPEDDKPARAPRRGADVGQKDVADAMEEGNSKGYFGTVPDETPNEHYTVAGVTAGKPTPETVSQGERRAIPDADAPTRDNK